jgi:VanZ family protein
MTTGVILIALAIHDEWHQSLVLGRTAAATDVLIDIVGGLLALFSFGKFKSR